MSDWLKDMDPELKKVLHLPDPEDLELYPDDDRDLGDIDFKLSPEEFRLLLEHAEEWLNEAAANPDLNPEKIDFSAPASNVTLFGYPDSRLDPDDENYDQAVAVEKESRLKYKLKHIAPYTEILIESLKKQISTIDGLESLRPDVVDQLLRFAVSLVRPTLADYINLHLVALSVLKSKNAPEILQAIAAMHPYLSEEVSAPRYDGKSLSELFFGEHGCASSKDLDLLGRAFTNACKKKMAVDALPGLQSSGTPKYYTSPNSTLVNALQALDGKGEVIGAGPMDLPVLNIGRPDEVTIYVNATLLDNSDNVKITGKPFTEYDRAVHDAVISLYDDRLKKGQPAIMTVDMVYRAMTHKQDTEFVSPQQKEAVARSIDKMRSSISVCVDASEEARRRKATWEGKPVESFKREGFLLSADRISITAGGEAVDAYLIQGCPLLLAHARMTGLLLTVNGKMLDIRALDDNKQITDVSLPNNEKRIAIKAYMLRRIEIMRSDEKKAARAYSRHLKLTAGNAAAAADPKESAKKYNRRSRCILLESVFAAAGITNKNTKTSSRTYICQILEYWKAAGFIKDYSLRKKGKTVDAVLIEL